MSTGRLTAAAPLHQRHCEACRADTPTIQEQDAIKRLTELHDDWRVSEDALVRDFVFTDFVEPFGLATKVALLAEQQGHHPDLRIEWGRLSVLLTTHIAQGLTENDFILAAKIDQL